MCKYILFTYPFGWDELGVVASILGVAATVWAVLVALSANRNANEQLQSALKIQEQSKNVELLDKRLTLIQKISDEEDISSISLEILFNNNKQIIEKRLEMANQKSLENIAEHRIKRYLQMAEDVGATQTLDEIERYEQLLSLPDCPEDVDKQFEHFCCENVFYDTEGEERIPYNYYDLCAKKLDYSIAFHANKGELIKLMKDFVEDSIKPLTEEECESEAG